MRTIRIPQVFNLKDLSLKITISTLTKFIKHKRKKIAIDFSKLDTTTKGDIMVLLAQIEKSIITNRNIIYRRGSLPKNKKVKKVLMTSMDLDLFHVNKNISVNKLDESEKEKLLYPDIIDGVVKGLRKVGIKDYYTPFNEFLIELIANAVEHGISNRNINWWLTHEMDWKTKKMKYTFVDMGLGIVGSHKQAGLPLKYRFKADKHVVLDALYAKLGSSTKESNRGRGLPQLRDMIERGFVSDLTLISNNVSLYYKSDKFVSMKNKCFIGTYYSWTIDKQCFERWKN